MEDREQLRILRGEGTKSGPETVALFLKNTYPDEPGDEHELAHIIGEASFQKNGYGGFEICDSFMRYACYHGVILEAIRRNGYNEGVMKNLAEGCRELNRNRTTITACIHGIGHGIMWVKSYDLVPSYQECEHMFDEEVDRFFCYDGVSMENVVRRSERQVVKNNLESKDPLYPRNAIPMQYQAACAREHIHHVRRAFYNKDTAQTAEYCLSFKEEPTRKECFGGLGSALNQDYGTDPKKIINECEMIDAQYRINCIGVAATQYAFGRQLEYAAMLCNTLPQGGAKEGCLGSVQYAKDAL